MDRHPDFYWDIRTRRYRWRDTQQFAPREAINNLTRGYISTKQAELIRLADQWDARAIAFSELQVEAARILKEIHLAQAYLGRDGVDRMAPSDFLEIARELKRQYYAGIDPVTGQRFGLRFLFEDLRNGRLSSARFRDRLRKFGDSGKVSYWAMARKSAIEAGKRFAFRTLHSRQECASCRAYASFGAVPISQLVLPTQRCECGTNCKCQVTFV